MSTPVETQAWWPAVRPCLPLTPPGLVGGWPGVPRCPSDLVSAAAASDRQWTARCKGLIHSPLSDPRPATLPPAQPERQTQQSQPSICRETGPSSRSGAAPTRPAHGPISVRREGGSDQAGTCSYSGSLCSSTWPGPRVCPGPTQGQCCPAAQPPHRLVSFLSCLCPGGASRWFPWPRWRKEGGSGCLLLLSCFETFA